MVLKVAAEEREEGAGGLPTLRSRVLSRDDSATLSLAPFSSKPTVQIKLCHVTSNQ